MEATCSSDGHLLVSSFLPSFLNPIGLIASKCPSLPLALAGSLREFLKEALALWGGRGPLRVARADSGVKRLSDADRGLRALDEGLCGGRVPDQVDGLEQAAAIRGGAGANSRFRTVAGKKTDRSAGVHFPGVGATSLVAAPEEKIWRDYNHRADMENRIAELKHRTSMPPTPSSGACCRCSTC